MASGDVKDYYTQVDSSTTGLKYDCHMREIEDGCHRCKATGRVRFSTQEDLDEHYRRLDEAESDSDYWHIDEEGPSRSGEKDCEACDGRGWKEGNGPLLQMTYTMPNPPNFKNFLELRGPDL